MPARRLPSVFVSTLRDRQRAVDEAARGVVDEQRTKADLYRLSGRVEVSTRRPPRGRAA